MTADEAFNYAINRYPLIYAAPTKRDAHLKWWDHVFNTIGNGYRDTEEFIAAHNADLIHKENLKWLDNYPTKYISGAELYFLAGKLGEDNISLYTKTEVEQLYKDTKVIPARCEGFEAPYPNFKKEYSLVWRIDLSKLDDSWISDAITYYEIMNMFFLSNDVHLYHDAIPENKKAYYELVDAFKKGFERYITPELTSEEFNALITKEYGCEFTGDIHLFIKTRWNNEHNRIKEFISETLQMLRSKL